MSLGRLKDDDKHNNCCVVNLLKFQWNNGWVPWTWI